MRNTRFGTRKLIFEDGSGVWLRRRHCRRGSGDKEVLGGGFEAVVVIAAITEDHQRTKGDSKLEEALNAWNILFDSGDEAEKSDMLGERERKRSNRELNLARQGGRLEHRGFELGQGLERAQGADGRPPHFMHSHRELGTLGQPGGNERTIAVFCDVRGKAQLHREVVRKTRADVATGPVVGVVRLDGNSSFSDEGAG